MNGSVIVPCYNDAHLLGQQLEALAGQEWPGDWSVVIVDDGSSDNSSAVAQGFNNRLPNLQVIVLPMNRGLAAARNVGARKSSGEALLFLDADDVAAAGYVHAMARALRQSELVCSRLEVNALNAPDVVASRGQSWQWDAPIDEFGYLPHGAGASLGVRREPFNVVNGFDESLRAYEDVDFCWRAQLAGFGPIILVPEAILHYRLRSRPAAIARQAWSYGRAQAVLRSRYAVHGTQPATTSDRRRGRREVARQELRSVRFRTRAQRLRLLWVVGVRLGVSAQRLLLHVSETFGGVTSPIRS